MKPDEETKTKEKDEQPKEVMEKPPEKHFDFTTTIETLSTIRKLERYKNDLNLLLDEANLTEEEASEIYNAFSSVSNAINSIQRRRNFLKVNDIGR